MSHRLPRFVRRLVTILAAALTATAFAVTPAHASPDPCANSNVSIGDYIMWDAVGAGPAVLPVYSLVPCNYARVLTYRTFDITAKAGQDYVAASGTVTLPAGSLRVSIQIGQGSETTISIEIIGDNVVEHTERFGVQLVSGAKFDKPVGIVTLLDG